jgi:uncharacterized protein YegJ (DUF2314 family)
METSADNAVIVRTEDLEMKAAVEQARATIDIFYAALKDPKPGQTSFFIKARFENAGNAVHIWLADIDIHQHPATGVVSNDTGIASLACMDRVPFHPEQVSDWMYMRDGQLVGGFTTRVLRRAQARQNSLISSQYDA